MAEPLPIPEPPRPVPSDEVLHVIVRAEDDGSFFVRSPQVSGLAYGAPSLDDVHAGLEDVLAFALDRPGPFRVAEHHERHFDAADREIVVRLAVDEHYEQRREAYARLARAVRVPEQTDDLLAGPADIVGEVLYVCAVPSDTVNWIAAQLDPGGAATLAVAVADELLLTYHVHHDTAPDSAHPSVRHDERETVADMMRTRPIVQPIKGSVTVF